MRKNSIFGYVSPLLLVLFIGCINEKHISNTPIDSIKKRTSEFISASSILEVREQIEKLPKHDIWWNVYGEDQLWNNKNLHRFMPTVNVYREGQVSILNERLNANISNHNIDIPQGRMSFQDFIKSDHSTIMGIVIVKDGEIVYELYPRQESYEKPIYWSVTKVLVSALVGILEDREQVDVSLPISHYIPELVNSDYKDITVRNVLDMATGVNCPEEYKKWESCYYQYSVAVGDGFWDETSPKNPYKLLAELKPGFSSEQGTTFNYSGVNTFLLSWLVEKEMKMPFQDALTKEIWSKMGAESDASILAPRFGVPITHGGLLARLRDVARFGMLYTPSYSNLTDEKIISNRIIKLIRDEGNPKLWEKAFNTGKIKDDFSHSIYQWDQVYKNHDFYKGGWGGQGLLVNPDKNLVVAFTGYFKDSKGTGLELLPILRGVLKDVYPDIN
jgi:CubicO group peptidase (beta-lactamase class C family)